jgi:hypothetical protein
MDYRDDLVMVLTKRPGFLSTDAGFNKDVAVQIVKKLTDSECAALYLAFAAIKLETRKEIESELEESNN